MSRRATRTKSKAPPNPVSVSTRGSKKKPAARQTPAPTTVQEDLSDLSEGSEEKSFDSAVSADLSSVASPLVKSKKKGATTSTPGSASSSRCYNTRRTNSAGLHETIQIALAEGIESRGGRDLFFLKHQALSKFCDETQDNLALFGAGGSERRDSVRFKVRHWRDLPKEAYNQAIRQLGVFLWEDRSEAFRQAFLAEEEAKAQLKSPPSSKKTIQDEELKSPPSKRKTAKPKAKKEKHFASDLSYAQPQVFYSSSLSEGKPPEIGFSQTGLKMSETDKSVALLELAPESVARESGVDLVGM